MKSKSPCADVTISPGVLAKPTTAVENADNWRCRSAAVSATKATFDATPLIALEAPRNTAVTPSRTEVNVENAAWNAEAAEAFAAVALAVTAADPSATDEG